VACAKAARRARRERARHTTPGGGTKGEREGHAGAIRVGQGATPARTGGSASVEPGQGPREHRAEVGHAAPGAGASQGRGPCQQGREGAGAGAPWSAVGCRELGRGKMGRARRAAGRSRASQGGGRAPWAHRAKLQAASRAQGGGRWGRGDEEGETGRAHLREQRRCGRTRWQWF
jgi:hypothetical protein